MHLQRQENEGKEWERGRHSRDAEESEKNSESTFHTLTEMLVDTMQVPDLFVTCMLFLKLHYIYIYI